MVLDSFCLQSIVLDRDRSRVLDGVCRRLRPGGRYVLSTAMFDQARGYGTDYFDPVTGMIWISTSDPGGDAERIDGSWFVPHRRHLTVAALRAEIEHHGLRILQQSAAGSDFVCALDAKSDPGR